MRYDILHELPGRMRVHCRHAGWRRDFTVDLDRWLDEHDELVSASLSLRTGNLLVVYSRDASRETILALIGDLRLFGVAAVGRADGIDDDRAGRMRNPSTGMEIFGLAAKPFLSAPIGWALAGWRWTLRLHDFLRPLKRGDAAACLVMAAGWLVRVLIGRSFPLKLFMILAGAALRRYNRIEIAGNAANLLTLSSETEAGEAAG